MINFNIFKKKKKDTFKDTFENYLKLYEKNLEYLIREEDRPLLYKNKEAALFKYLFYDFRLKPILKEDIREDIYNLKKEKELFLDKNGKRVSENISKQYHKRMDLLIYEFGRYFRENNKSFYILSNYFFVKDFQFYLKINAINVKLLKLFKKKDLREVKEFVEIFNNIEDINNYNLLSKNLIAEDRETLIVEKVLPILNQVLETLNKLSLKVSLIDKEKEKLIKKVKEKETQEKKERINKEDFEKLKEEKISKELLKIALQQ